MKRLTAERDSIIADRKKAAASASANAAQRKNLEQAVERRSREMLAALRSQGYGRGSARKSAAAIVAFARAVRAAGFEPRLAVMVRWLDDQPEVGVKWWAEVLSTANRRKPDLLEIELAVKAADENAIDLDPLVVVIDSVSGSSMPPLSERINQLSRAARVAEIRDYCEAALARIAPDRPGGPDPFDLIFAPSVVRW
ncbi:MAG TPA: hypothetical protein VG713_07565, partial [Pirellulales bacterium]|nr:hypothetical protein [Pirellulales bacterium]